MRQRQSNCAEHIGVDVQHRHHEADVGFSLFVGFARVLLIVDEEPGTEDEKSAGKRDKMHRVEQVEHAATQRQHRKGADAAGASYVAAVEKIFKCEPKKSV